MERHQFEISHKLRGLRLDHALAAALTGLSRRRAKAIIDLGGVYLNQKRTRVASRLVSRGDKVEVEYDPTRFNGQPRTLTELTPAAILYSDAYCLVINKPAQLPAQATRDQAIHHVIPVVQKLLSDMGQAEKNLHLVHRLDKDTTGCLIIARSRQAMDFLSDQFRLHTTHKTYHALCHGIIQEDFVEKCFLSGIQPNTSRVKVVSSGGRSSHTLFNVLERFPNYQASLVSCTPITGRSHQIRVHLEKNNHPILGDKVYGEGRRQTLPDSIAELATHQLLHARSIQFQPAPGMERVTVEAEYPETFTSVLANLRI